MYTISTGCGVVTGGDHRRLDRPGQDATAVARRDAARVAVAVVCDGCGSTPHAEVGAALGARLVAHAVADALAAGADPADPAPWAAARAGLGAWIATLAAALGADRDAVVHDLFLFTLVAAAVTPRGIAVYAVGDGGYVLAGEVRALGPFADNQPPYVTYDLLGDPRPAVLASAPLDPRGGAVLVATDGAAALDLAALAADPALVAHPDALRRHLAIRARAGERIDWDARRVVRTPAILRDDAAIAILRWEAAP